MRELARQAGVDVGSISRLESGKQAGQAGTIARITAALGLDPDRVQSLLRAEELKAEANETQYIDLSKVPERDRPRLRRAIDAMVRQWEQEDEEEEGR